MNIVWARGNKQEPLKAYDGFANFCLEITYQQYLLNKEDHNLRFVNFQPNLIIDLEEMIETNERFEETGNIVQRFLPAKSKQQNMKYSKVFEPMTSYKLDSKPKDQSFFKRLGQQKEYSPIQVHSTDNISWLAQQWIKQNGSELPTRQQILDGIIEEDKQEILRLFPRYSQNHAAVQEVLKKRALAWKTLCAVSGFSIKNMDAPVKKQVLQDQPFHPLSSSVVQIMILDSTIRNAISRACYEKKTDSIKSLGPICVVLMFLIETGKQRRQQ